MLRTHSNPSLGVNSLLTQHSFKQKLLLSTPYHNNKLTFFTIELLSQLYINCDYCLNLVALPRILGKVGGANSWLVVGATLFLIYITFLVTHPDANLHYLFLKVHLWDWKSCASQVHFFISLAKRCALDLYAYPLCHRFPGQKGALVRQLPVKPPLPPIRLAGTLPAAAKPATNTHPTSCHFASCQ